jgi:dTDP-L-rhamnose 4-epimerase
MRVLITGGAGFIGGHLVDRFLAEGWEVRILDNLDPKVHPFGKPRWLPPEAEFVNGDVTDPEAMLYALRGVDVVSHHAAYQDYMPDFSRFFRVNAVGTALLYELIVRQKLKIKKVIVASSQAIYGEGHYDCARHGQIFPEPRSVAQLQKKQWDVVCPSCGGESRPRLLQEEHHNPYNQYAVSKLSQERAAVGLGWLYGIPSVALRYSITQGPRQSLFNHYSGICRIFVSRALRGEPLRIYEDGKQTRDFIHIQDVIEANMAVLHDDRTNFHAFNVGSGKAISVLEYAQAVRKLMEKEVELQISHEYRLGDNRHSVSSIDKLSNIGWRPKRNLSAILNDFITWVKETGGIPEPVRDAYSDMKNAGVVLTAAN